jgi:lipoprotein-anchoring transpeptidase ErfK/SrfK
MMLNRRTVLVSGAGLAAAAAVAGCSSQASGKWASRGGGPSAGGDGSPGQPVSTAKLTITPATDTSNVSPADPVTVAIDNGTLESVTVTAGGKTVKGSIAGDQKSWKSSGTLSYSQTYTVAVTAKDSKGAAVTQKSNFATIKPSGVAGITFQANPMASMKDGGTYGVGQPAIVYFSKTIKDRTAAEAAMEVTTEPAVEGRWHWVSGQSAHWRPEKFWPAGTKITVKTNLLGVNLGNNVYGGGNNSIRFTIGPSRIAIADSNTHMMQVFINGQMVRNIPVSMGKGGSTKGAKGETVEFWTRSGVHVLMTKEAQTTMSSASYGITDKNNPNYYSETIKLACRISLSGEYVHMADWNIPAQGHRNTSHGCVNVGPDNARWFFNTFGVGDVVEVRNTPKSLPVTDGIGDWNVPWGQWT